MTSLPKNYRRDCLLGALSALLMLVGDLCLSLIPASPGDSGLFLREAYLNGSYPTWRLPLLLGTGLMGMALGVFTVRVSIAKRAGPRALAARFTWPPPVCCISGSAPWPTGPAGLRR